MSTGKPVMIYIERNCARLIYPDDPPILNCHSEEEIYEQIMKCADRQFLERLGKEAREWVYKYHNWETCLDQFIFYYTLLTGHQIQDYGWEKNPYKKDKSAGELV
jgi:glycosyltransferase involved in cell wall biosynthesis